MRAFLAAQWHWVLAGLVVLLFAIGGIYLSFAPDETAPRESLPTYQRPSLDGLGLEPGADSALSAALGRIGPIREGDPRYGHQAGDPLAVTISVTGVGPLPDYSWWISGRKAAVASPKGASSSSQSGTAYGINPTAMVLVLNNPETSRVSCSITIEGQTVTTSSENRAWKWLVCAA